MIKLEHVDPDISISNALRPICPHCSTQIEKIYCNDIKAVFGRRYIYFCSNCLKVLGISHRKGFWMG